MSPALPLPLIEFFTSVVALSWRASWLILALVLLRLLVRGRVPAQLWFGAWVLVGLRLVLPFAVPAEWSPYNQIADARAVAVEARAMLPGAAGVVAADEAQATAEHGATPASGAEAQASAAPIAAGEMTVQSVAGEEGEAENTERFSPTLLTSPALPPAQPAASPWWAELNTRFFAALWLAGGVVLGVIRLVAELRFRAALRGARVLEGLRELALLRVEAALAGVTVRIQLVETKAVDAPALFGLLRPRLLLPVGMAAALTDEELRVVLRHELGHWRRRDLWVQALLQVAVVVHWFNPLAWLAARTARTDCELACDEFVLGRGAEDGAATYGSALLKVLGMTRGRRRPVAVVAMLGGRGQLAQRIRLIAGYRTATLGRVVAGVAVLGLVLAVGITREAVAQETMAAGAAAPVPTSHRVVEIRPLSTAPTAVMGPAASVSGPSVQVVGQAVRPGLVAFPQSGELWLTGAIAQVGGVTPAAKQSAVIIWRRGRDGRAAVRTFDLDAIAAGTSHDMLLEPGDMISVPQRAASTQEQNYTGEIRLAGRITPPPAVEVERAAELAYVLQPLDLIKVEVFMEAEINKMGEVRLSADSLVTLPLIDKVDLKGLSVGQARELITRLYDGTWLMKPSVNVRVLESSKMGVRVIGEVGSPGLVRFPPQDGLTLLGAMARAGSFTRLADKKGVTVLRRSPEGKEEKLTVDMDQVVREDVSGDISLLAGDVVEVPKRYEREVTPATAAGLANAAAAAEAVKKLEQPLAEQQQRVDEARRKLVELKGTTESGPDRARVAQLLASAAQKAEEIEATIVALDAKIAQFDEYRAKGKAMDLSFVAQDPGVAALQQRITAVKIELAALNERYLERHPNVRAAMKTFEELNVQMGLALDRMRRGWDAEYSALGQSRLRAQDELVRRTTEQRNAEALAVRLAQAQSELTVQELTLSTILKRMTDVRLAANGGPVPAMAPWRVSVIGEVRNPGPLNFAAGESSTVFEVIAAAGGFTDLGNGRKVRLIRKENNEFRTSEINVHDLLQGHVAPEAGTPLQAGDVVYVPAKVI